MNQHEESKHQIKTSEDLWKNIPPGGYIRCIAADGIPLIEVSERFLNILGWSRKELETIFENRFMNLVHPDDRKSVEAYIRQILKDDQDNSFEDAIYRLQGKDGFHWVSDTTMKIAVENETFLQCVISDVSRFVFEREEKQMELENLLKASEERYEIIRALSAVYQEISVIDLDNQTYELVSGCGRSKQYQGLVGPIREFRSYILNHIIVEKQGEEAGSFLDFETAKERLREKPFISQEFEGRNQAWYLVTLIAKNRDMDGEVTHVLVSARNINDQKKKELLYQKSLEEAVEVARRANEAKSNFLSRMSHDIRTPINAIVGLLKIDEAHFDNRELIQANHEKMMTSADHLLSLINDVLQMSKLEDGDTILTHEFISLVELTQDIVTIVIGRAIEAGIEWNYEKGKSVIPYPYIYGSPLHLRQIFLNIYGNCIKYTKPGGKITTIVEGLDEENGKCAYRWTISDTGVGMSEEFLKHIFEPFAQERNDARSEYQGTGLGMAIVKNLVEKMNGSIEVSSKIGEGSTFVITIPFEIAPPPSGQPAERDAEPETIRGLHVMLAEDNALNAEIAEVLLEDEGIDVTVVHDGKQAVDCFEKNPAGTFDAILMDVMMPVMDGLAATRHIRALHRPDAEAIPIIAMTANAFYEDAKKCYVAGMNAHLAKPLEIKKVITTIAQHCRK